MKSDKELAELFDNNFDCYTTYDKNDQWISEPALTRSKFIELMKNILNGETVKLWETCSVCKGDMVPGQATKCTKCGTVNVTV